MDNFIKTYITSNRVCPVCKKIFDENSVSIKSNCIKGYSSLEINMFLKKYLHLTACTECGVVMVKLPEAHNE